MWLLLLLLLLLAAAAAAAAGELWVNFLVEDTQVPPVLPAHVGVDGRLVQLSKTRGHTVYVKRQHVTASTACDGLDSLTRQSPAVLWCKSRAIFLDPEPLL